MKKLRLDVDHLRVESFPTAHAGEGSGTVRAYDATQGCPATQSCTNCTYDDTLCGISRAGCTLPPVC